MKKSLKEKRCPLNLTNWSWHKTLMKVVHYIHFCTSHSGEAACMASNHSYTIDYWVLTDKNLDARTYSPSNFTTAMPFGGCMAIMVVRSFERSYLIPSNVTLLHILQQGWGAYNFLVVNLSLASLHLLLSQCSKFIGVFSNIYSLVTTKMYISYT